MNTIDVTGAAPQTGTITTHSNLIMSAIDMTAPRPAWQGYTVVVPSPHAQDSLLTFKEAMSYLRVSRSTVYRLMQTGQLVGHKVGVGWRFYRDDLHRCVVGK